MRRLDSCKDRFDLFVSNIVFENFGKRRLDPYDKLLKWMTPKSYAVLSEPFFNYKIDYNRRASLFGSVQERPSKIRDSSCKIRLSSFAGTHLFRLGAP